MQFKDSGNTNNRFNILDLEIGKCYRVKSFKTGGANYVCRLLGIRSYMYGDYAEFMTLPGQWHLGETTLHVFNNDKWLAVSELEIES